MGCVQSSKAYDVTAKTFRRKKTLRQRELLNETLPVHTARNKRYDQLCELIKEHILLKYLNEAKLTDEIIDKMTPRFVKKDEVLVKEGTKSTTLYLVLEGSLTATSSAVNKSRGRNNNEVGQVLPGGSIGEAGLVFRSWARETVTANETTETWALDFDDIPEGKFFTSPAFKHFMFSELAVREQSVRSAYEEQARTGRKYIDALRPGYAFDWHFKASLLNLPPKMFKDAKDRAKWEKRRKESIAAGANAGTMSGNGRPNHSNESRGSSTGPAVPRSSQSVPSSPRLPGSVEPLSPAEKGSRRQTKDDADIPEVGHSDAGEGVLQQRPAGAREGGDDDDAVVELVGGVPGGMLVSSPGSMSVPGKTAAALIVDSGSGKEGVLETAAAGGGGGGWRGGGPGGG